MGINNDIVYIPLGTKGTKIMFESRVPTLDELNNLPDSQSLQLTSLHPWNPESVEFSEMSTTNRSLLDNREIAEEMFESMEDSDNHLMVSMQESLCIPTLRNTMISTVKVHNCGIKRKIDQVDVPARCTLISTERHTRLK